MASQGSLDYTMSVFQHALVPIHNHLQYAYNHVKQLTLSPRVGLHASSFHLHLRNKKCTLRKNLDIKRAVTSFSTKKRKIASPELLKKLTFVNITRQ